MNAWRLANLNCFGRLARIRCAPREDSLGELERSGARQAKKFTKKKLTLISLHRYAGFNERSPTGFEISEIRRLFLLSLV